MSTSLTPDQNLEQQPNNLESQSPPIPPISSPIVGPNNDSGLDPLLLESLRDANRRLADAERQLADLRKPAPPIDSRTPDQIRADYFDNPEASTRRTIREEMNSTIAPLMEFVNQLKGNSVIDNAISNLKKDPRLTTALDSDVESYVRSELGKLDPKQINDNLAGSIVLVAIGMKNIGMIRSSSPTPSPTPTPAPTMPPITPPYIRTDPLPISPAPTPSANTRPLNEHEIRLLNEHNARNPNRKMTPSEYIQLGEIAPGDVATSKIGIR